MKKKINKKKVINFWKWSKIQGLLPTIQSGIFIFHLLSKIKDFNGEYKIACCLTWVRYLNPHVKNRHFRECVGEQVAEEGMQA